MGATEDGEKDLIAVRDGFRESEASWTELLQDVKDRGLKVHAKLRSAKAPWVLGRCSRGVHADSRATLLVSQEW